MCDDGVLIGGREDMFETGEMNARSFDVRSTHCKMDWKVLCYKC